MYGAWILVIVFGSILLVGVVGVIVTRIITGYFVDDCVIAFFIVCFIGVIGFLPSLLCATLSPIWAKNEVNYWREFSSMTTAIYADTSDLGDIYFTSEIVEYNTWLAEARASQQTYGNWSKYYKLDLSDLQYIGVGE